MSCTMRCSWLCFLTEEEVRATAGLAGVIGGTRRRRAGRIEARAGALWVAAERRALVRARHRSDPAEALVEIVRGRLEGSGPVTRAGDRRRRSACRRLRIDAALAALRRRALHCAEVSRRAPPRPRMVRAPPARAHSSLHGQATARRDRTGAGARFPALPVRVAAGAARGAHAGPGCGGGRARAARGLRGAGRRLGDRHPAGADRGIRARSGWTSIAAPADSCGRGSPARERPDRRRAGAAPVRVDAHHAAGAAQRQGLVGVHRRRPIPRSSLPRPRAVAGVSSRRRAHRSSTTSPTACGCCRPRPRRRLPSWWRSVW